MVMDTLQADYREGLDTHGQFLRNRNCLGFPRDSFLVPHMECSSATDSFCLRYSIIGLEQHYDTHAVSV
eukprot:scaffold1062_cov130-Cylindrotheca_fusiformis.AAC.16